MKNYVTLTIATLSFFSFNLEAQKLKPGLWKANANFNLNGVQLPSSKGQDCVRPSEVKDVKATIEDNLKDKGCSLTKWVVKGKNIEAGLDCRNDLLEATGNLKGQFTEKSYTLNGVASGTYSMVPTEAKIALAGEWVKACK